MQAGITKRQRGVLGGRLYFRMRQDAQDSKNANYLFLLMYPTKESPKGPPNTHTGGDGTKQVGEEVPLPVTEEMGIELNNGERRCGARPWEINASHRPPHPPHGAWEQDGRGTERNVTREGWHS